MDSIEAKSEKKSSFFDDDEILTPHIEESTVHAESEEKATLFVWLLVIAAAIGGLLFGYDTGVIGGTLIHEDIAADLHKTLNAFHKELLTSATTLGAMFGSIGSGLLADAYGRKMVIGLADVVFIVGAVLQAVAFGPNAFWIMAVGRLILGVGVGLACLVVPLYIGELAPTRQRGKLVTLNVIAITFGQVVAYCINLAFQNVAHGWRAMVALGALPPVVQVFLLVMLPESPRFLLRQGRFDETLVVMRRIYPNASDAQIRLKAQVIDASVRFEIGSSRGLVQTWKDLHFIGVNFRGLVIACGLQAIQQLCGFNTFMYFAPTLFENVGFTNPLVIGLVISIINLVFTLVASVIIDPVGRRRIALVSTSIMCFSLVVTAISFHYLTIHTDGQLPSNGDTSRLVSQWNPAILTFTLLFVAAYAVGVGNIPWQQGELFEMGVRGMGTAISTFCNWGCNFIIGSTFLSMLDSITAAGTFGFYSALCFLGFLFCLFLYPETAGLSLEETKLIFENGFGIRKAEALRKDKKRMHKLQKEARAGQQIESA